MTLKAKIVEYEDGSSALKLLVEEEKEPKIITSPSVLLELQDCQEGDVYKVQMKYRKIGNKPLRYYEVSKIEKEFEEDKKNIKIPILEDDENEDDDDDSEPPAELFG